MNTISESVVSFDKPMDNRCQALHQYVYNSPGFIKLKKGYEQIDCTHYSKDNGELLCAISFLCRNTKAVSLPQSPFGGFSFGEQEAQRVNDFVPSIVNHLKKRGIKEIIIKSPASFYLSPNEQRYMQGLLKLGFIVEDKSINHHIPIGGATFDRLIHKMQIRRLKKGQDSGLVFGTCAGEKIPEIYDFILACRNQKGVKINITKQLLLEAINVLPDVYKGFYVKLNGNIVAATITVQVSNNIIYNYLPASDRRYNYISPMVYLIQGIYNYCQGSNVSILDLGISTLDKLPQSSLIKFKERIGGVATEKLTYKLVFDEKR